MSEIAVPAEDATPAATEHYCTLFGHHFLPQGLALHESLLAHDPAFILWVLCVDDETHQTLERLALPGTRLVALESVEADDLLAVKDSRTIGEYCWTLTSSFIAHLLETHDEIPRVTYLDADCFFFSSPRRLLTELDRAGKDVLITPHAYTPQYDLSEESGVYCVQFVTFARSDPAMELLRHWRSQCVEWCYARSDNGRFGDQKYLDAWPDLHPEIVHVLQNAHLTLAPWNVEHFKDHLAGTCMYHFHKFRLIGPGHVVLFDGFRVSETVVAKLYVPYLDTVARMIERIGEGWDGYLPESAPSLGGRLSNLILRAKHTRRVARFSVGR